MKVLATLVDSIPADAPCPEMVSLDPVQELRPVGIVELQPISVARKWAATRRSLQVALSSRMEPIIFRWQ
jgi:hypothetical protein